MNSHPTNSQTSDHTCSNSTKNSQHRESTGIKSRIHPNHYTEWLNSYVDPGIIDLNVQPLSGITPYEHLLYGLPESERRNDGRVRDYWLNKYQHLEEGGWWCSGIEILTLSDSLWGCFKPNQPRTEEKPFGFGIPSKTKVIKYEHPPKVPTEIFALRVPHHIWDFIAARYGIKRYHSPLALRLADRHQPITFWEWILKNPQIPIIITEGAKKAGAILTAGYVAIALPGVNNGYRQPKDQFGNPVGKAKLIPQLELLALEQREIIFAFDNDPKPKTVAAVRKAILKTGKLLQLKGSSVSVITWNYPDKGVDDLIANRGVECFDALYKARINLSQFQLLEYLDLSPYVSCRVNQQYLGIELKDSKTRGQGESGDFLSDSKDLFKEQEDSFDCEDKGTFLEPNDWLKRRKNLDRSPCPGVPPSPSVPLTPSPLTPPPDAQIIGIKSPKGTGKTQWLSQQVEQALNRGQPVLNMTHRIPLGRELGSRLGLEYRTELTNVGRWLGYSLCVDSLHPNANPKFNPDDWCGAMVIIDEAEQVIWHLLSSGTCIKNRVAILETFQKLVQTVIESGGKIYLSDADLSPIAIEYIHSLIGYRVKTWVVENTYNPNPTPRKLYNYDTPSALVSALVKAVATGEKVLLHVGAQKVQSPWGTINLESMLASIYPHKNILRIDSESVGEPGHPAFGCVGNLNQIFPLYDIVLASPTIETGVSIDVKHFDSVWCLASGIQTVDAVAQVLERVRDDVPRHLFAKKYSSHRVGRGETDINALLRSTHQLTKHNIALLSVASAISFDETQPEHLRTWAKRACVINTGFRRYRESILEKLNREGYEILAPAPDTIADSGAAHEAVKITALVNYSEHCTQVSTADNCSNSELEELKKKTSLTPSERLVRRKGELTRKYATDNITPSMVKLDDDGWYPKLKLHYYLTIGKVFLPERDRQVLTNLAESGNGKVFKPDVNARLLSSQIAALEKLEILQFLAPERSFTSDSLREWFEKISQPIPRSQIKTILGMSINPARDTPIGVAQRLLELLGLKMECIGRLGSRGARARVYRGCNVDPDGREAIFSRWLVKDTEKYHNDSCPPLL